MQENREHSVNPVKPISLPGGSPKKHRPSTTPHSSLSPSSRVKQQSRLRRALNSHLNLTPHCNVRKVGKRVCVGSRTTKTRFNNNSRRRDEIWNPLKETPTLCLENRDLPGREGEVPWHQVRPGTRTRGGWNIPLDYFILTGNWRQFLLRWWCE